MLLAEFLPMIVVYCTLKLVFSVLSRIVFLTGLTLVPPRAWF